MKKSIGILATAAIIIASVSAANATLKLNINTQTAAGGAITFNYDLYNNAQQAGQKMDTITRNASDTQQVMKILTQDFNDDAQGFAAINGPSDLTVAYPTKINNQAALVQCSFDVNALQAANLSNQTINIPQSDHCRTTPVTK